MGAILGTSQITLRKLWAYSRGGLAKRSTSRAPFWAPVERRQVVVLWTPPGGGLARRSGENAGSGHASVAGLARDRHVIEFVVLKGRWGRFNAHFTLTSHAVESCTDGQQEEKRKKKKADVTSKVLV